MTSDAPSAVTTPNNLPHQATAFVDREAELALIAQHLADPDCRLVTLVGPGGMGKTRLALEAAERAAGLNRTSETLILQSAIRHPPSAFPDGVFLVRLEALSDASFIAPTIAGALDVPLQRQQDPVAQLIHYL